MEIENLFLLRQPWGCSPRLSRAKPACAGYGGGNTPHDPCASVIAAPIRVLFRLSRAKPACAGATLRVRAEALPERGEDHAGPDTQCGLMEIEQ